MSQNSPAPDRITPGGFASWKDASCFEHGMLQRFASPSSTSAGNALNVLFQNLPWPARVVQVFPRPSRGVSGRGNHRQGSGRPVPGKRQ